MTTGRLYVGTDTVDNGNINRSPSAYLKNPENERAQYVVVKLLRQIFA